MVDEQQAEDWKISPMVAKSFQGVAPAFIAIGDADILHDEGKAYADKLIASRVDVTLHDIPGMVHEFIEMYREVSHIKKVMKETAVFLQNCFNV